MVKVRLAVAPAESETLAVKEYVPAVVAKPVTMPALDKVSPGGMLPPVKAQVNGPTPPFTDRACEYPALIDPLLSVGAVAMLSADAISRVNGAVAVTWFKSVACTVKL